MARVFAAVGGALHEAARAHGRWEVELSARILERRKKLLAALLIPVVLGLLVSPVLASHPLPEKLPILGGSKAFVPSVVNARMFFGSILVGLIAGLLTGVIGAGGGYILTPALMSFDVRGIMAVGTDQFHLFAKAIMGTAIHRKLGNVNLGLAGWFVAGSVVGVTLGGKVNRAVFQHSPALSDALISCVYVVVLGVLGAYALADWVRMARSAGGEHRAGELTSVARWLQSLPLRPRIRFDQGVTPGGRSIPVYPVVLCGAFVGFLAAIMGVGGGFFTFPMFIYGLGVSTFTTVGTDILQIIFTTSYSSIVQYAIYGFVFYTVAVGMLLGSLVGVQIGAIVTKMVKGGQIRAFYALTILAGFANRLCALPRKLGDLGYVSVSRRASVWIETTGTVVFFAIVGVFAMWILAVFFRHVGQLRRQECADTSERIGLVVDHQKFAIGAAGLVAFLAAIGVCLAPVCGGETCLARADRLFNRLSKHSANGLAEAAARSAAFKGRSVDLGVRPRDEASLRDLARVVEGSGARAEITEDGRLRIQGDLGRMAEAAVNDARALFDNDDDALKAKYGAAGEDVVYCWWAVFGGLSRRYAQEGLAAETNFARLVTTKVLEPAYNFRGIQARPISENVLPVVVLLVLYVAGTVWYGMSVMLIFEGMGIRATCSRQKKEA